MQLAEYAILASRTDANVGSPLANVIHMVLGISSEYEELCEAIVANDTKNIREELGDIMWYVAGYCRHNNIALVDAMPSFVLPNIQTFDTMQTLINFAKLNSQMANVWKRKLAYKKEPSDDQIMLIEQVIYYVLNFCRRYNFELSDVCDINIKKLLVRYKDKFSQDQALIRNLEAESEALE